MKMEELGWTRRLVQITALGLADPMKFERALADTNHDVSGRNLLGVLRNWGLSGAQSVCMPPTFAAALAASGPGDAVRNARLPWNTFEVQVPPGLLPTSFGDVASVFVSGEHDQSQLGIRGGTDTDRYLLAYTAGVSSAHTTHVSLGELLDVDDETWSAGWRVAGKDEIHRSELAAEKRLWTIVKQLVAGVILTIEQCRQENRHAYSAKPLRLKRNGAHTRVQANTFVVGKALKLDCREAIADYLNGSRRTAPRVCTMVRGHWTHQAHGPGHSLRRLQWRKPHLRGEGPMLVRPVSI